MRAIFTISIILLSLSLAHTQPPNDECLGAIPLTLGTPTPCPNSMAAINNFTYSNVNATPTSPYPALANCAVGGSMDAPAAEVWFSFTATGTQFAASVSGLSTPNIAIFQGATCGFLQGIECGSAAPGSGQVAVVNVPLIVGNTYYIMVSGGDVNDQGSFNLSLATSNTCDPCIVGQQFTASPPPVNGTWSSGQTVNFCFTISGWNVQGGNEWLHSITVDFGAGWDLTSLQTFPPPSCDNQGFWGWYDSWVSCNTGQLFQNGFAYESSQGVGCGGAPLDGNPGNNWGDGANGCATAYPPTSFCWQVTVDPNSCNGTDLSVEVDVWTDGNSGSWGNLGCQSGQDVNFLASAVCCFDAPPFVQPTPSSCPGQADGNLIITGGGLGSPPGELYDIVVFDASNNIVFTCNACSNPVDVAAMNGGVGLPSGDYTVIATNVLSGCTPPGPTINIAEGPAPTAIATALPACPGQPIQLMGSTTSPGFNVQYFWTGPPGFTPSNLQNPTTTIEGAYTLIVTVDGCQSDPTMINVQYENYFVNAMASATQVCVNSLVTLTANGNVDSYTWTDGAGNPIGVGQTVQALVLGPTTFTVTGQSAAGCSVTSMVFVDVFPPPVPTIIVPNTSCEGVPLLLDIQGGPFTQYLWSDLSSDPPPRVLNLSAGNYTYSVTVTDQNNCVGASQPVSFTVSPLPDVMITPDMPVICAGESVTLTASGANSYSWSTNESGNSITVSPTMTTTYSVTGVSFDNCQSTESVTVIVDEPNDPPVVSCGTATPNSVEFELDDSGYQIDVLTNQSGTLSGTTFIVNNLLPGEDVTIEVTASSNNTCDDVSTTITCTSQNCPVVDVSIDNVPDICLDPMNSELDTLDLDLMGATDGDTLWSGPGIIDDALGVFDPVVADTGVHEIVVLYTEGQCIYTDTIEISVFPIPTADFEVSSDNICVGDSIIVTYTGSADTTANFSWSFNGGDADPGTGIGSHAVSWNTSGTKTISLIVTENGCASEVFSLPVTVVNPIAAPMISCINETTTSVEFTWPTIAEATGYTVNVLTNQTGMQNNNTFTVTGLAPGETVTIEVIAETDNPCGNTSAQLSCSAALCPTFNINIDPVADICLDGTVPPFDLNATISGGQGNGASTWTGLGITDMDAGTFDPEMAGAGTQTLTLTYVEGPCSGSEDVTINLFDTPLADFTISSNLVCIDETITVLYDEAAGPGATFTWNFNGGDVQSGTGPGPHTVSWGTAGTKTITLIVEENNCTSMQFSQTVEVEAPMSAPVINCMTSTSSIEFSWPDVTGADSYNVTVLTNQSGTLAGNTFTVDGLSPGETVTIEVEAVGSGPCGNSSNTETCVAEDCPMGSIVFDPVDPICLDASAVPITLNANITGVMGNGMETWDGNGITDMAAGVFDPQDAQVGTHTISYTYQEGNCTYNGSLEIIVNGQPDPSFTVDDLICIDESSSVVYSGDASVGATYNWDFDDGTADPGIGQGPHEVSWSEGGSKTITLTVTENDCTSEVFTQTLQVDIPLDQPVISCSTTNTSITFSWNDVPGATGYQVVDVTGPAGVLNGTTYEVTGLSPGTGVIIQVIAEGTTDCGSSMTEESCVALDCPDFTFNIDPIPDFCSDAGIQTLTATVSGGAGNGTLEWSGDGISDPSGTFDPSMVMPGTISVLLTYTEGVCVADTNITLTVLPVPTADFTVSDPICLTQSSLITYTGTASAGATYTWDFDGGIADPGTGAGPHMVSWPTSGSKNITLTVEEDGCESTLIMQTVQVDEPLEVPLVSCMTTQTSIIFSWDAIPGAIGYDIIEVSGATGTLDGTTYTVTDLMPGDVVTIQVVALGDGACGDATTEEVSCSADDCEDISFAIAADISFCGDEPVTTLMASTIGGMGNGTFTWSGDGIIDPSGIFDPSIVPPGDTDLEIVYVEGACTYDTTIAVTVFQVPTATFTVTDPICITESALVTYTGNASANATYDWDFDGGSADPGTGQGPHALTWINGGLKTISLTVTENDCISAVFTQTIQVDEPLADPAISCTTDNTFIIFNWDEVVGATGYQVEVLSGQSGTQDGTSFTVENLTPGDMVSIRVIALGDGACGNSMAEESCIAAVCPDIAFDVPAISDLCANDAQQTFTAAVIGGVGDGTFTWAGPGIVNPTGIFDPSMVIPGDISLNLEYVEGVCSYDTTIMVTVFAAPTADFTATSPICVSGTSTLTYEGTASASATFVWDFGNGTATPGTGIGPHEVSWSTSGTQTITLTVIENGCESVMVMQQVEVEEPLEAPVVNCEETSSTSIIFSWDDVPGATGYEVEVLNGGPTGMIVGNTYVLTDLTPQESVTIQVTALGDGSCGNSVGEGTCVAQDCPMVSLALSGTEVICRGSDAIVELDFSGDSNGPFTITYTLNGQDETSMEVTDGTIITLPELTNTTNFEVLNITDNSLPDCIYPGNANWEVQVNEPTDPGVALAAPEICVGTDMTVTLVGLIENPASGGQWVETSDNPSSGGAFNAATGEFNPMSQTPGTYSFSYQITGQTPCPDVAVDVEVVVVPAPIADAGMDQELTCNMGMVSLGGNNSSGAISYNWTADDGNIIIANPTSQFIEASQPGTYTLTVVNAQGCTSTDEVVVMTNFDVPVGEVSISPITCFQANDGGIFIDNVTGGVGPYEYSLNGGPFSAQPAFVPLGPDNYSLVIQDQNGCFTELSVDLTQPEELFVELTTNLEGGDNLIRLGESVRLEAIYNPGVVLDTIIWEPDSVGMGNTSAIWVSPTTTSNYSVTIIDENGCSDSDDMTVFVRKERPVYFPNVFSPNNDGFNDIFYIQSSSIVREVKSFLIFNRWGESLIELYGFQPNDPAWGWDGTFRGQVLNPGVYVYYAEIEFEDGVIILYEGDVSLMR